MSNERWAEQGCWEWVEDCRRWRGEVLHGRFMHWCRDWDGLPVDETTPEWPCACASPEERMESAAMLLALPLVLVVAIWVAALWTCWPVSSGLLLLWMWAIARESRRPR